MKLTLLILYVAVATLILAWVAFSANGSEPDAGWSGR